jgi:hypothetical protein
LETAVDANRILGLINRLKPIQTQHELMRVGPDRDGGYLIPDDIEGITTCFSAGSSIDSSATFELDLSESFGIDSHLVNRSMEVPPGYFKPLTFIPKFLGPTNNNVYLTLDSWVKNTTEYEYSGQHLLLKLDLEGSEYSAMLTASEEVFKRFRIIVLKLNDVDKWGHPAFFRIAEDFTNKILQYFNVVHVHPSNKGKISNVSGIPLPEILEITLLAKKRCNIVGYINSLPDELDKPCNPEIADLVLPDIWYK